MKIKPRLMLILLAAVLLFNGLNASSTLGREDEDGPEINKNRIVILPVFKGRYGNTVRETIDSPVPGLTDNITGVSDEAGGILTYAIHEEMELKYGPMIAPLFDGIIAFDRIERESDDTIRSLAQKTGEILKVKRVMAGYVWRYKRRVGSSISASSPASVGFTICLIDVPTGEILWKGSFEESQKSLSENLLKAKGFFKRGAKWLSAEDLARFGIKEMLEKQPIE